MVFFFKYIVPIVKWIQRDIFSVCSEFVLFSYLILHNFAQSSMPSALSVIRFIHTFCPAASDVTYGPIRHRTGYYVISRAQYEEDPRQMLCNTPHIVQQLEDNALIKYNCLGGYAPNYVYGILSIHFIFASISYLLAPTSNASDKLITKQLIQSLFDFGIVYARSSVND